MEREHLLISGGNPLHGELILPGAKNAITKLLVASILSDKPLSLIHI